MNKKIWLFVSVNIFVVLSILNIRTSLVRAETCEIKSDKTVYDSIVSLSKGDYMVYSKLNRKDQSTELQLNRSSLDPNVACSVIGLNKSSDLEWTLLGHVSIASGDDLVSLQATIGEDNATQDASAPTILFLPTAATPCVDPNSCTVDFQGSSYLLEPKKLSMNSDTLKVAAYESIENSTIKEVLFYSDGKPLYSDKINRQLNEKRIEPGKHALTTRVVLSDGQALVTREDIDISFDLGNFLSFYYYKYRTMIITLLSTSGIYVLYVLTFTIINHLRRRRLWKLSHLNSIPKTHIAKRVSTHYVLMKEGLKSDIRLSFWLISFPLSAMLLFLGVNLFVVSRFQVNGISMETTLHDKSKKWMYKLPISIANFNKSGYVPSRGDVVVFRKNENNLFVDTEQNESFVVKRVIGLPNDRVQLKDGNFTIFNNDNLQGFDPDKDKAWSLVVLPSENRFIDITLKEGEIFVVGDNRMDSIDSRYYGPIKTEQIVGKVPYQSDRNSTPYVADLQE